MPINLTRSPPRSPTTNPARNAVAELELSLIVERVRAGMRNAQAVRDAGVSKGCPFSSRKMWKTQSPLYGKSAVSNHFFWYTPAAGGASNTSRKTANQILNSIGSREISSLALRVRLAAHEVSGELMRNSE